MTGTPPFSHTHTHPENPSMREGKYKILGWKFTTPKKLRWKPQDSFKHDGSINVQLSPTEATFRYVN